jgi:hypothetical protein
MRRKRDKYGYTIFFRHDYDKRKLKDLLATDGVKFLFKNFYKFNCLGCGEEFLAQNKGTGTKYCSAGCRNKASRQRLVDRLVEEEIARRKEQGLL